MDQLFFYALNKFMTGKHTKAVLNQMEEDNA